MTPSILAAKIPLPYRVLMLFFVACAKVSAYTYHLDLRDPEQWFVSICDASQARVEVIIPSEAQHYIKRRAMSVANNKRMSGDAACFHYQLDLTAAIQDKNAPVKTYGASRLSYNERWLFLPASYQPERPIKIEFALTPKQALATPWRPLGGERYESQASNFDWPSRFLVGDIHQFPIRLNAQQQLTVNFANSIQRANAKRLMPWLETATQAIYRLYQRFPQDALQIIVLPAHFRRDEALPFAQVLRGGEASVIFFVNQQLALQQFTDDWTAYHELSHLLIPFVERDEAWLSEGLASYYQYYVMALAGTIDHQTFWRRLVAGFKRGAASHRRNKHLSLEKVTPLMFSAGAVRRVYWSGAILWFTLDVELRRQRGIRLIDVLQQFNAQYMPSYHGWRSQALASALDTISATTLFSSTFATARTNISYPAYQAALKHVGISENNIGELLFAARIDKMQADSSAQKKLLNWQYFVHALPQLEAVDP